MFEEYNDNKSSIRITIILTLIILLITIFFSLSSTFDKNLFYYLGLSSLVIILVAFFEYGTNSEIINANFFGDNKEKMYLMLFLGSLIGLFLTKGVNFTLPVFSISAFGDLNKFLITDVAPVIEALFWRGILFPTFLTSFTTIFNKNKSISIGLAVITSSFLFGFYHTNAYLTQTGFSLNETITNISYAAFFGFLWILGTSLTKTIAFEIGWHRMNNLIAFGLPIEQILIQQAIFIIGFVILYEFLNKENNR